MNTAVKTQMVSRRHAAALGIFLAASSLMSQTFSGYYEIVNAGSGMVLEVPGSSTSNGVALDQWIGNGGANQQWSIASAGGSA